MSFAAEYPEQRYILPKTTVQRAVLLPEGVMGTVAVREGQAVEMNTVIARGRLPAYHHIVDAAVDLRLRNPDDVEVFLLAKPGEQVQAGQVIAGRNPNRGRRAFSPADGMIAGVANGRIVVREFASAVEVVAGMRGFVTEVRRRRGAIIQTVGAVLQGIWGNGQRAVGAIRMEPEDGLDFIRGDEINMRWRGSIVVTRDPLTELGLSVMDEQDMAGVIAPSMDATLLDTVVGYNRTVMLTEGFGLGRMSAPTYSFLEETVTANQNIRGTLDAVLPGLAQARRPELIMTVQTRSGEEPPPPKTVRRLRPGMQVRVVRPPFAGQTGRVDEVLETLFSLEGGLRVPAARVTLTNGETTSIPIVNLELFAGTRKTG